MTFYTIKEAIRGGRRLKLSLADGEYVVEPHVLVRNRSGETLLRAYQLRGPGSRGKTTRWRIFRLDCVCHAVETGDRFTNPRAGYQPNDSTMRGSIIERI